MIPVFWRRGASGANGRGGAYLNNSYIGNCCTANSLIDTEATYEEVTSLFGKSVADGVNALTKNESLPAKHEQMMDSLTRIKMQPVEIWMVKLADRNCRLKVGQLCPTNRAPAPSCKFIVKPLVISSCLFFMAF